MLQNIEKIKDILIKGGTPKEEAEALSAIETGDKAIATELFRYISEIPKNNFTTAAVNKMAQIAYVENDYSYFLSPFDEIIDVEKVKALKEKFPEAAGILRDKIMARAKSTLRNENELELFRYYLTPEQVGGLKDDLFVKAIAILRDRGIEVKDMIKEKAKKAKVIREVKTLLKAGDQTKADLLRDLKESFPLVSPKDRSLLAFALPGVDMPQKIEALKHLLKLQKIRMELADEFTIPADMNGDMLCKTIILFNKGIENPKGKLSGLPAKEEFTARAAETMFRDNTLYSIALLARDLLETKIIEGKLRVEQLQGEIHSLVDGNLLKFLTQLVNVAGLCDTKTRSYLPYIIDLAINPGMRYVLGKKLDEGFATELLGVLNKINFGENIVA